VNRMKQAWVTVRGLWSDRPAVDWILVAIVVVVHAVLIRTTSVELQLSELSKDDRMRFLTTAASVSALLFGFATASIAFFYGSAKGDRVDLMKGVMSKQLVAAWRAALSAPLVAVGVCLAALLIDTGKSGSHVVQWSVEVAVLLLAARGVRLRWLFTSTLSLMAMDATNPNAFAQSSASPTPVARPGRRSTSG
jgi:hypothetical protein